MKVEIHVAMSIYSYDAKEHDKVTLQKGSHDRTVHAVELLKEYDIPHRIATVYRTTCPSLSEQNIL